MLTVGGLGGVALVERLHLAVSALCLDVTAVLGNALRGDADCAADLDGHEVLLLDQSVEHPPADIEDGAHVLGLQVVGFRVLRGHTQTLPESRGMRNGFTSRSRRAYDRCPMSAPRSETSGDTPFPVTPWRKPATVELVDGRLVYGNGSVPERWVGGLEGHLRRFARLHKDEEGQEALRFAQDFGPIWLCDQHNLPSSHIPHRNLGELLRLHDLDDVRPCSPLRDLATGLYTEPVSGWMNLSRQCAAMLTIADQLRKERIALHGPGRNTRSRTYLEDEPWSSIADLIGRDLATAVPQVWVGKRDTIGHRATLAEQRLHIGIAVDRWMQLGDVRTKFLWNGAQPRIEFGTDNLFGALAMELGLMVARSGGFATCSGCRLPYTPSRRPREDQENYCQVCGDAARKRDWRKREADKKRGTANGGPE